MRFALNAQWPKAKTRRLRSLCGNSVSNWPATKAAFFCMLYGTAEAVPHKNSVDTTQDHTGSDACLTKATRLVLRLIDANVAMYLLRQLSAANASPILDV